MHARVAMLTVTRSILGKHPPDDAADATSDMYRRSFFAHREARSDRKWLFRFHRQSDLVTSRGELHDERTRVKLLMAKVQMLKNPLMMNPPKMHLISEIPDPAA